MIRNSQKLNEAIYELEVIDLSDRIPSCLESARRPGTIAPRKLFKAVGNGRYVFTTADGSDGEGTMDHKIDIVTADELVDAYNEYSTRWLLQSITPPRPYPVR